MYNSVSAVGMKIESNPPSRSTLTFLFTDIVRSSPLWDGRPDEMRVAMRFHDYVLTQIVERQSGRVFRKTGDGICASFVAPGDALSAGIKIQAALQNMPGEVVLTVRMAIHAGLVHERDDDYTGEPLNRVSRILDLAEGGQILLSSAAAALLAPDHREDITLRELGTHSLKGLTVDETIHQVLHASLSREAPAIMPSRATGKLPIPPNSFVGRSDLIEHLAILLEQTRLVTLIGTGGIGKTRLSVEAASRCSSGFEYGTWFVDLQNVVDPDKVMTAVAAAFGIGESPGYGIVEAVKNRLGSRRMLLLVDNCEQVQAGAAAAIRTILDMAPRVHILATSREVLGLREERVVPVTPLAVPAESESEAGGGAEAVRLFVDRALYANPAFRITEDNLGPLCRLAQRLDGIPLAIELAAARMRSMSLDQLVKRQDDLFALLKTSRLDQSPRHQTLLATMDWSYRLLSAKERTLFARLGVFAGSWSVETCEEVAGAKPLRTEEVLDLLSELVDKSLVVAEEKRGEMRYRLLETLRAYARSKLATAKDADAIRERFFDAMRALATRLDAEILGHEQLRWRRLFDLEIDNFRSALDWGLLHPNRIEDVATLVCHLARTWLMNGEFSEARSYFDLIEPRLPENAYETRARVRTLSGSLRFRAGDRKGIEMLRSGVELAEKASRDVLAECVGKLAAALFELGEIDEAEVLFRRELELNGQPPARPEGYIRLALGAIAAERGEYEAARAQYRIMLEAKRASGDRRGEGLALCYLAHCEAVQKREEATELYREAIACFAEVPDYYSLAVSLGAATSILVAGAPEAAAQIQGYTDQLVDRVGATFDRHVALLAESAKEATLARLREDRYSEWYEEGKFLDILGVLELLGCPTAKSSTT